MDLSSCKLEHLRPLVFSELNEISIFILDHNLIENIKPEHFEGMIHLTILKVSHNRLQSINPSGSAWNVTFQELHLSHNLLVEVSEYAFHDLQNFKFLDLSHNSKLKSLRITSFSAVGNLEVLNISHTNLIKLSLYAPLLESFICVGVLGYQGIEGLGIFVPGQTFNHSLNLDYMDLSSTKLTWRELWNPERKVSLFHGLSGLKILYLTNTSNRYFPSEAVENLTSLLELHLNQNNLKYLPSRLLANLKQLKVFNIGENWLMSIEDDTFRYATSLETLVISSNMLDTLNKTTIWPIRSSLISIDLSDNNLRCDCRMKWLVKWLKGPVKVLQENQTTCWSSQWESMVDQPLLMFDVKNCDINITVYCLIPVIIMIAFVFVIAVHRYRWLLRYKIFQLNLVLRGRNDQEDIERLDFDYDLNIIFTQGDEEWVQEQLQPALEERLPEFNRKSVGDDDLPLGMHYLDAVHYMVQNSYKTILLLSRAAVRDNWFLLKFRTAMDHMNTAQLNSMLVIFVEHIPPEELPYVIRLYLGDNNPYLTWTADEIGREYFWIQLVDNITADIH